MNRVDPYMAVTTPMSRTRAARPANTSLSCRGLPNSLTSIAPATLNRSVMVEPIAASSCMDSRVSRCSRRPTSRAGITNAGIIASVTTDTSQDRLNMAISTRIRVSTLDTIADRVEVMACCAPMTSLLSRLTSDPVWARVKKAIGCRWTCENTSVRRS